MQFAFEGPNGLAFVVDSESMADAEASVRAALGGLIGRERAMLHSVRLYDGMHRQAPLPQGFTFEDSPPTKNKTSK